MSRSKNVHIPADLYAGLENLARKSGFDVTDDLILFILQDYLDQNVVKEDMDLTQAEEKKIRDRLKDLGYT